MEGSFWHRPLWSSVISGIVTWVILLFWGYLFYNAQEWEADDKTRQEGILKSAPCVEFQKEIWNYEEGTLTIPFKNCGEEAIYTQWNWNSILTQFQAKDDQWNHYKIISTTKNIEKWWAGQIIIDIKETKSTKLSVIVWCQDNSWISPTSQDYFRCNVKWTSQELLINLPNYEWLSFLFIDATKKDDTIGFKTTMELIVWKWGIFYVALSNWISLWEGVLRINRNLFRWEKVGFIFYNDAIEKLSWSWYTLQSIKKDIQWQYTHLSDWFEVYSFTEMEQLLDKRSSDNRVRKILHWIWDCNGVSFPWCTDNLGLYRNSTAEPPYTEGMLKRNNIDILVVVPTVE